MKLLIACCIFVFSCTSFSADLYCPLVKDLELIDVNEDYSEPITFRFQMTNSSHSYITGKCEFETYELVKAFIGRSDDFFDDLNPLEILNGVKYRADLEIQWQDRDAVTVYYRKQVGKIESRGDRLYLRLLVPYKIVVSENSVYLDIK